MERTLRYPLYYDGNVIIYNGISIIFTSAIQVSLTENFFYPYYCVIYRGSGTTNSLGAETFSGIFYGICGYDYNPSGSTALKGNSWQASPTVIVPDTDALIEINDKIVITLDNGRVIEARVKQFEVQKEPGLEGTTIWLTDGRDD